MRHIEVLLKIFACTLLIVLVDFCNVHKQKVSVNIFDKQNNKEIGKIELAEKNNLTEYRIELSGLQPQKNFIIKLYSGNCDMLSASSTIVSRINTDNDGNGNQVFQNLLFPEGIICNREFDQYRTTRVNTFSQQSRN